MSQDSNPEKKEKPLRKWLALSGIGFQMGATIFLFAWVGKRVDAYFQTEKEWFTIIGVLLGVFISFYSLLKTLKKINK